MTEFDFKCEVCGKQWETLNEYSSDQLAHSLAEPERPVRPPVILKPRQVTHMMVCPGCGLVRFMSDDELLESDLDTIRCRLDDLIMVEREV